VSSIQQFPAVFQFKQKLLSALLGLSSLALIACSRPAESGGPVVQASPNPETNTAPSVDPKTEADASDSSGIVNIAPERLKEIGASTEVVSKRFLTRTLNAPARAEIDESALRDINVKAGSGFITKLYASYEGFPFHKGQPLMRVLCEGWLQTQIDYIKAYRDWKRSPLVSPNNSFALDNQLELMRARIRVWDLSDSQIHSLEAFALSTNEIDLRTGHGLSGSFDVLAPFDGYVHVDKAIEGLRFEAGQSLLELADDSRVWIVAEFPENQAMYVNEGQKMTVTFPSMPQQSVKGEISFIDPHVEDQERRITARIVVSDPDHIYHPGVFAEVSGAIPIGEKLSVSSSAVVPTGDKFIVFVDHGGGQLEPREVHLGARSGDNYEVLSGLKEGDRVV
jgi:Cu(I)/Ag(I) efflux system membrane fusion protein